VEDAIAGSTWELVMATENAFQKFIVVSDWLDVVVITLHKLIRESHLVAVLNQNASCVRCLLSLNHQRLQVKKLRSVLIL